MRRRLPIPIGGHELDAWALQTAMHIELLKTVEPGQARLMDACAAAYVASLRRGIDAPTVLIPTPPIQIRRPSDSKRGGPSSSLRDCSIVAAPN